MQSPGSLDKDFIDLVAQEVRGFLDEKKREILYTPENLDHRYTALNSLKKDVESQLANHKARMNQKRYELQMRGDDGSMWLAWLNTAQTRPDGSTGPSPSDWRARAIKFLAAIESHLTAAKYEIKKRNITANGGDIDELLDDLLEHQEEIGEDDASPADKRLWARAASLREGGA